MLRGVNVQTQKSAKQQGAGVKVSTEFKETGPPTLIVGGSRKVTLEAWTVRLTVAVLLFCEPFVTLYVKLSDPAYPAVGVYVTLGAEPLSVP